MIILLAAALAASASPEAERLGRELASSGAIETILPAVELRCQFTKLNKCVRGHVHRRRHRNSMRIN